jgi:hypothetical protein
MFIEKDITKNIALLGQVMILIKKSVLITGLDRPRRFHEVKVSRFRDNGIGW